MRRLTPLRGHPRGFTLVETLVTLSIFGLLAMAATPVFHDYLANSKLREGGNALLSEALYAQAEAVKRNGRVSVTMLANSATVRVFDVQRNVELRRRRLPDGLSAGGADVGVIFGGSGRPVPFGTAVAINLTLDKFACSADIRCPGLRVDGGGGMQLCKNTQSC